ncbi:MAG: sulfurtransferase [Actinomycetia bacterium]|nr:sulfurtransferase [Actinomycetes bacterium]
MDRMECLATPDDVHRDSQLLDVRWGLHDAPDAGVAAYLEGHIPGARFLDLATVLTGPTTDPTLGRHPLPDADALEHALSSIGLDPAKPVIVYDVPGSFASGRAWWVLTWAGLHVRVLDGGWPAWLAAGGDVETGKRPLPEPTKVRLSLGHLPTVDEEAVESWPGTLIDVRAAERFRGTYEPIDAVAGHIPGAINRPVAELWTPDGRLPSEDALREYFGVLCEPVAVYCGSGVSAAHGVFALRLIGIEAALYPPSWSGWSADPDHAVATGE